MRSPDGKYAWMAKIGDKGQIVIPKEARELFDFTPGKTVILLGDKDKGLAIVPGEMLSDFANEILGANRNTPGDRPEDSSGDDPDNKEE